MMRAIALARRGTGATYPNPCVGALLFKGERELGKGRSSVAGGPHAEVRALRDAGAAAKGAELYVTLEPCSHQGRTPPCARSIIEAGVARVYVGVKDPNPAVSGRGIAMLRRAGVEVQVGVAGAQARELHEHYLFSQKEGRPFVTLKAAISLDGYIATLDGDSKWITGEGARRDAHKLRALHHAIAVGAETLLHDDPALTVRMVRGKDPRVVVFDPRLRCAARGQARARALRAGGLVLHARGVPTDRVARLRDWGLEPVSVAVVPSGSPKRPRLKLASALKALGKRDIRSLMVEGGGRLLGAFVAASSFEQAYVYEAPVVLGEGRPVFAGVGKSKVAQASRWRRVRSKQLGEDRLTVYRPARE
jgi:diaminohydroxyphosphoribosylaminopyrimidine deaminase/5-amino-6-(5-phosphoribosylamino)uracil reductase